MKMRTWIVMGLLSAAVVQHGCESPTSNKNTPANNGNGTGAGTGPVVTPPATAKDPAQIALIEVSTPDIGVSGTGSTETSVATYEVRDSTGTPVGAKITVQFGLQFYPNTFANVGTAPRIMPPSASTDDNGRVAVSVLSGTQAGVIQLLTSVNVGGGRTVNSQPVRINVHAGFPDQKHFTLSAVQYNFPGLDVNFITDKVTALVGDKYSNPVVGLTSVYFHSTHGVVTTDKAITNADGFVTQTLYSAKRRPEASDTIASTVFPYLGGNGWTRVYAQTFGDSAGSKVLDSIPVLWTGVPRLINLTGPGTFALANGGSAGPWTFSIVDRYGHPMSSGTQIIVSGNGLKFTGNCVNLTMPDVISTGSGITDFFFVASDADPGTTSTPALVTSVVLTVVHPIYGTYNYTIVQSGTVQ